MHARTEPEWLKQIRDRRLPRSAFVRTKNAPSDDPLGALRVTLAQGLVGFREQVRLQARNAAEQFRSVAEQFRRMLRDQGGFLRTGLRIEPAARQVAGYIANPHAAALLVLAAIACTVVALPILAAIDALRTRPEPRSAPVAAAMMRLVETAPLAAEPAAVVAAAASDEPATGSIHPKTDVTTPIEALVPAEPAEAVAPAARQDPIDPARVARATPDAERIPEHQSAAEKARNSARKETSAARPPAKAKAVRSAAAERPRLQQRRSAQAGVRVDPRRCAASERCPEVDPR